jgi:NADH:ubiquinone oxidoreductase subunit E
MGSSCYTRGNDKILEMVRDFIETQGISDQVDFRGHLCKGQCNKGPNISIGETEYHEVSESNIRLILNEAFEKIGFR